MNKLRFKLTASEIAMGRVMRAPDHPTEGEGGGDDTAVVEDPTQVSEDSTTAETDDFAAFEKKVDKEESFGEVDDPATETGAEGEEPEAPEGKEPEGKEGNPVQPRIDELTATAREAERRAAELERILNDPAELRKRLGEADDGAKGEEESKGESELLEGEPDPKDYAFGEIDKDYIKDSAAFHARIEFQRQEAVRKLSSEFETIDRGYEERAEKAVERYPDFEEKVVKGAQGDTPSWKATAVMSLAMKTSEVGPDVAYYLATNPQESERIAALSPLEQAREMGRLDGRFMYQDKPVVNKVSNAPTPPTQVSKGSGSRTKPAADTDDFAAFDKGYTSKASGG